jgi:hypothetical protein
MDSQELMYERLLRSPQTTAIDLLIFFDELKLRGITVGEEAEWHI